MLIDSNRQLMLRATAQACSDDLSLRRNATGGRVRRVVIFCKVFLSHVQGNVEGAVWCDVSCSSLGLSRDRRINGGPRQGLSCCY